MSTFSNAVTPEVRFGLPLWMRIYAALFGIVWFGGVSVAIVLILSSDSPASAIMPAVMFVFGAFIYSQIFRLGVRSSGDDLVVRNNFGTRMLRRSEIEGFRHGQWLSPVHRVIFVTTRDEVLPLHVTMHAPFAGKRRAEGQLAELRAWLG